MAKNTRGKRTSKKSQQKDKKPIPKVGSSNEQIPKVDPSKSVQEKKDDPTENSYLKGLAFLEAEKKNSPKKPENGKKKQRRENKKVQQKSIPKAEHEPEPVKEEPIIWSERLGTLPDEKNADVKKSDDIVECDKIGFINLSNGLITPEVPKREPGMIVLNEKYQRPVPTSLNRWIAV